MEILQEGIISVKDLDTNRAVTFKLLSAGEDISGLTFPLNELKCFCIWFKQKYPGSIVSNKFKFLLADSVKSESPNIDKHKVITWSDLVKEFNELEEKSKIEPTKEIMKNWKPKGANNTAETINKFNKKEINRKKAGVAGYNIRYSRTPLPT